MDSILRGLNAAQRAAVTSPASVLQVLAPPGSGKTKTLTSRVAYLLSYHGYAPRNVICCTFTIKAAREMRERLRGISGCDVESKLILGTFHSICRRYLVSYGHLIGLPKSFGIADSTDSLAIIKRAVKKLKLNIDPKTARAKISHRKARGQRIEELGKTAKQTMENQELATVYMEYEVALATSNLLDYDDLLLRCKDLLQAYPHCVSNVEALLIDEFQDTNVVQFELMKLLASAKKCITIVGDPDQSIYGFRSAEIENLRRMKAYYPETVVIHLEENYRSSSAILSLAQEVIDQDMNRPDKKLKATHCHGTRPVLRRVPNPHEEALWIVNEIQRMRKMTGGLLQYSDIAILLRSAFLSLLIEKALGNAGIPYKMVGGHRFFDRAEIRTLLDYLRTISQPGNNSALLAIINVPSRKLGETTTKELLRAGEGKKLSLWATLQKVLTGDLALEKNLSKPAEQNLRKLVTIIEDARKKMSSMQPTNTPQQLLDFIIRRIDFRDYLKAKYEEDHEERWENVQELLLQTTDMAQKLQSEPALEDLLPEVEGVDQGRAGGSEEALAQYLANIVLSTELETSEDGRGQQYVTISTIHSAKGLEWPIVFVPAVYEGSIPHSRAEDTDEERRLLYVAMTRAQALLTLSFPVFQSRDQTESILSQFLPDKTTAKFFSATGPDFSDKYINDVASILGRPMPSQEELVRGLQSLTDKESPHDDLWPADGTARPRDFLGLDTVQLHAGENPLSRQFRYDQFGLGPLHSSSCTTRSLHLGACDSAMNGGQQISTLPNTTTTRTSYPTFTGASGFISASRKLETDGEHETVYPQEPPATMAKSSSSRGHVKPVSKLKKVDSKQGSLSSFFATGSLKPTPSVSDAKEHRVSSHSTNQLRESFLMSIQPAQLSFAIPPELSSHQLHTTSLPAKRPRTALEDTVNPNRTRYAFNPSSPELDPRNAVVDENNIRSINDRPEPNTIQAITTFHTTSMDLLKQNISGKKTLGMRRTMAGWDARKNR